MPHVTADDGVSLYYEESGAGTPVLCLAGLTRNARDFDHLRPHLGGVRMICLDTRGRGRSDWPGPEHYTIPREARDALNLMNVLGLARAAILGTSRGGLIAMVLAATAKDRLNGVALNDIGPEIGAEGLKAIEGYLGRVPDAPDLETLARARARLLTGFDGVPHARWLAEVTGQFEETPRGLALRYDARLREPVLQDGAQPLPDLWPLFDALDGVPLALIRGANSILLTAATADEMARRRPDMIRAEVPGRGHVPFLDEPEALAALTAWIDLLPKDA